MKKDFVVYFGWHFDIWTKIRGFVKFADLDFKRINQFLIGLKNAERKF